ncbi:MAG: hypothetical protein ACREOQ_05950, partial [Gemmatimonadales bacterium]
MPVRARTVVFLALWLGGATAARAQVPRGAATDSVARGLRGLTARLDSLESGTCPSGPPIVAPAPTGEAKTDSLIATFESLSRRLEAIRGARCAAAANAAAPVQAPTPAAADTSDELA